MISTVIIDDEEIGITQLDYLLRQYPEILIKDTFTDPLTAIENIVALRPDLVFLDVEMPGMSGLAVAEEIMSVLPNTCIVFVTAYDEYALKAFECNAIDYILKPVSARRIECTIQKVLKRLAGGKAKSGLQGKISEIRKLYGKTPGSIFGVEEDGKIFLLNPADIVMFTPQGRGAIIHTRERQYKTRHSMNYWEERLAGMNFFRCHKSYLVNLNKIERVLPMFNNTYLLKIAGFAKEIPVSRNKANEFREILSL